MALEQTAFKREETYIIATQLERIAEALERLLKYTEMNL